MLHKFQRLTEMILRNMSNNDDEIEKYINEKFAELLKITLGLQWKIDQSQSEDIETAKCNMLSGEDVWKILKNRKLAKIFFDAKVMQLGKEHGHTQQYIDEKMSSFNTNKDLDNYMLEKFYQVLWNCISPVMMKEANHSKTKRNTLKEK